ncbi:hypothetical protein [Histidinibacterium lentulum]|uniref:DUF4432 family protein n=1 Tax=Histidinibacterium lentulum TaxID=2480588 RepID=A0A3N2R8P0_9RHOB|nr:hypothetical protein [Histidinibacterium lentulum]ROU03696.1 hypothetical protein EAT49_05205 [Histidinibacterium lentulum]
MIRIAARGIEAAFAAELGRLDGFTVSDGGQRIAPLHRAPWVGTGEAMPADAPPLMAGLGGDFFCAPFALSDGDSPLHGWPPNVAWHVLLAEAGVLRAVCSKTVRGAVLVKELALADDHPFVYQRHVFVGGAGRVTAANHGNVSVPRGALIRTSPKSHWETPRNAQETDPARGRSAIGVGVRAEDPTAFPTAAGGSVDLTRYPWFDRTEDFVIGVEAKNSPLGWTAVTRPEEGDLYLSLRHPRQAPMSMFWQSNGGRDYAPWSGRHTGCLGVEEGAAEHMLSVSTEADLAGPGALSLTPGGTVEMRHGTGAIAWPSGAAVAEVVLEGDRLTVRGEDGAVRDLPFRQGFLGLEGP